jgi:alkylation response protein AidB-like acyl-CoA dehydrogenase
VDFQLTNEQQEFQDGAIAFARALPTDDIVARDHEERFSLEAWRRCADFGVLGMPIPEAYGGLGRRLTDLIAVMEGLGYGTRDQGLLFSINAHLWTNSIPILLYGTEEQRRSYLPRLCSGELIGANAASEPDAGSDIFAMHTRAERRGDHYVLSGAKMFVTNAPVAGVFATYATIDPRLGPMGITAFLVDRDTPGLVVGRPLHKMGLRTSPMAEVAFDRCVVPESQRLGREGRGVEVFECSMEWERGCILANCLGVMRRQLETCMRYARTRKQFGMAIGKFQSVANRIVDMHVRLQACRPLVYRVGWLKEMNRSAHVEAAMAKLYVSDCFVQSSLDAVQILGGYGYMTEMEAERDVRDAIGSRLYSGTSEIQRNIIARGLGL